jgi:hypothetical protein
MRELPDWIDNYIKLTEESEPPLMFRLWTAISVVAACLQRKCRLDWGSLTFYPNLYIVLVAPPGKARKGTAMKAGRRFLEELQINVAAESITREALVRELMESNYTNISPEGQMLTHSSLTIYSEELAVFLGQQNNQLVMDLTDWFDCSKKWTYRTKGSGTDEIIGVWVNLMGATTPDLLRGTLSGDAIGGGLTSRMIFVFEPRRGKVVPYPIWGPEEIALQTILMRDLERIRNLSGVFRTTEEFLAEWSDWYTKQSDNPPFEDPNFAGYIERRPTHVMKLSMILNASRTDDMILDAIDFRRAIKILEATEYRMPQALKGIGKNQNSDVLTRIWSDIALRKETTFQALLGKFYQDADKRTLMQIVETLESMSIIRVTQSGRAMKITYIGEDRPKGPSPMEEPS